MTASKLLKKPPCLVDPLATAGLARLYRERRKAAASRLLDALPELMSLTTGPTVEELLRGALVQRESLDRQVASSLVATGQYGADPA